MIKNIVPANIQTEPIVFKLNDKTSADILVQSFDYVPYVYIKKINDTINNPPIDGTSVDPRDIIHLKLHNSKFLPEIELYCNDSKGILFNDLYPFDHDTLICIFVKSNSENVRPIRMDFRVTSYETTKTDPDRDIFKYLIKGVLNIDELNFTRYESYKDTSYETIKQIALKMNLGFTSNVSSSDDRMTWINPSQTYIEFIKEITKYSFISEDTFIWTFIDFYYNVNYIDIQLELNEFNRTEKGAMTNKLLVKNSEEMNGLLYLTNNKAFSMTNMFISKFNLVNQSFKINLEKCYRMKATWYNKNQNKITRQYLKELETDQSKLENGEGLLRQLTDKTSHIYCENINDEYFIGKFDSENNVHTNYALAKLSNQWNFLNMEKMKLVITLNQINFSIKRFQTLKIEIYNPQDIFSRDADTKKPTDNINTRLSGYWYVTGINYIYKRTGGPEQEITLSRRDLSINYGQGRDEKNDLRSDATK